MEAKRADAQAAPDAAYLEQKKKLLEQAITDDESENNSSGDDDGVKGAEVKSRTAEWVHDQSLLDPPGTPASVSAAQTSTSVPSQIPPHINVVTVNPARQAEFSSLSSQLGLYTSANSTFVSQNAGAQQAHSLAETYTTFNVLPSNVLPATSSTGRYGMFNPANPANSASISRQPQTYTATNVLPSNVLPATSSTGRYGMSNPANPANSASIGVHPQTTASNVLPSNVLLATRSTGRYGMFNPANPADSALIGEQPLPSQSVNLIPGELGGQPSNPATMDMQPLSNHLYAARHATPKELPTFSGNPEKWPLFISSFENTTNVY